MPIEQNPLPGILPDELPAIQARDVDGNPIADPDPVCPCCGDEFDACYGIEVGGEPHCPDCVHSCDNCHYTTTDEDEIYNARSTGRSRTDDVSLCDECSQVCEDCDARFDNDADGGENANGAWVCERCAEHYRTCNDCDCVIHEDESNYHEGREVGLCNSCYRQQCNADEANEDDAETEVDEVDEDSAPPPGRLIHDYNYKPTPIFLRRPDETRAPGAPVYFGLEIEAENIGHDSMIDAVKTAGIEAQSAWYAKTDGSLNHGVEMVSHPGTWRYWQADDMRLIAELRKLRFRSYDTSTCGMHVHISRAAFTDLGVWKLVEFFRRNETLITRLSRRNPDKLEKWAGVNKGPGGKAGRASEKLLRVSNYLETDDGGVKTVFTKRKWTHQERYAAINLENAATVEIRIFRGTLDVPAIKRNIALCAALVEFVQYTSIRELEGKHFVRWLKQYGKRTIGEPEASELIKWVTKQAESVETEA